LGALDTLVPQNVPTRQHRIRLTIRAVVIVAGVCAAMAGTGPLRGQARSALVTPALDTALRQGAAGEEHAVWVYLRDKGARVADQTAPLSVRALGRRARRAPAARRTVFEDQALASEYVDQVAARVTRVRHALRWFNAISVEATDAQGGISTFIFTSLKENVGPSDKEFAFTMPRGVDVVTDSGRR